MLEKNRYNTGIIKIIAIITMLIDHIGAILFPQYLILRYIGRFSFPMFMYSVCVGTKYTSNINKYILRLSLFGLATMPIYYFAFREWTINIMLEMALFVFMIKILQNLESYKKYIVAAVMLIVSYLVIEVLTTNFIVEWEYGFYTILLGFVFYFSVSKNKHFISFLLFIAATLFMYHNNPIQIFCLASYPVICMLNSFKCFEKIKLNKYFYYLFYPGHLFVLGLINLFL